MKYSKSEAGQQAFKTRSPLLSARQRSAFLQFDGVRTTEQVLAATAGLGITAADVDYLVQQGFLWPVAEEAAASMPARLEATPPVADAPLAPGSGKTPQQRYAEAMPLATKVTASLGLRGFTLNLAVEAASGYDELLALLPRIQKAAGVDACAELEKALKGA